MNKTRLRGFSALIVVLALGVSLELASDAAAAEQNLLPAKEAAPATPLPPGATTDTPVAHVEKKACTCTGLLCGCSLRTPNGIVNLSITKKQFDSFD
jgi:hypothetical protein